MPAYSPRMYKRATNEELGSRLGYAFPRGISVPKLGMFRFHSPFQFCAIPEAFPGHLLCSDRYGAPTTYAGLSAEDRGMKLSSSSISGSSPPRDKTEL